MNQDPELIDTANNAVFSNTDNDEINVSIVEEPSKVAIETTDAEEEKPKNLPKLPDASVYEAYLKKLKDDVIEYCKKTPVSIAILTPCYNGTCCITYLTSIIETIQEFSNIGITIKLFF
jgi:hypothetical protein